MTFKACHPSSEMRTITSVSRIPSRVYFIRCSSGNVRSTSLQAEYFNEGGSSHIRCKWLTRRVCGGLLGFATPPNTKMQASGKIF